MTETQTEKSKKPPIAQLSADAATLYEKGLKPMKIGGTITYNDLSALIGRDVRKHAYGALQTARRIAQREDGAAFEAVWNVGLRRLNDVELIDTGDRALRHIGKTARRASRRIMDCTKDFNALSPENKVRHNARVSVFNAVEAFARRSALKKLEGKIQESTNGPLPIGRTLEVFKG